MTSTVADKLEALYRQQVDVSSNYDNWRLQHSNEDVLWAFFDKKGSSTNTLNAEVLQEFGQILDTLEETKPRGLVIQSLKPGGFCAGADIKQFAEYSKDETVAMLKQGHDLLDRLEKSSVPSIAVIQGHCLGGGLELALACRYRIGVAGSLQMGFPEINLGLHPGLGGTFRLTGLIDPLVAMTMMLTGKSVYGAQCRKRGLVDEILEERHVQRAVYTLLDKKPQPTRQGIKGRLFNTGPARKIAATRMRSQAAEKAPPQHYPAPNALIDLWAEHGDNPRSMQQAEIESFAKLLESSTSKNLVRVFFLQQALKEQADGDSHIEHVHVIGAGSMGGDIAAWCAYSGCHVTLSDTKTEPIAEAVNKAEELCKSRHKSDIETRQVLDRILPDPGGKGVARAQLVIEAVPEDLDLKASIYQAIEPKMSKHAILATNTSSIPLEKLATKLENPQRFVGMHFFNPVAKMLIVEIVTQQKTTADCAEQAMEFTAGIGKLPVKIGSYPGFLVNRALTPYLLEAIVMLDEGVQKEQIDRAAVAFGMPMGPLELADQVGLDICLHVGEVLRDSLETPLPEVPQWLQKKVDGGDLGKKSGRGFYEWKKGKALKENKEKKEQRKQNEDKEKPGEDNNISPAASADLTDRLILPLLNACVECYRNKVITDLDHLDAAMIFATGFAPFTGGPINYARTRGVADVVARLSELEEKYGKRFHPDSGWQKV